MNSEYEQHLATEIDRELKSLPELAAPPALVGRVMDTIDSRQVVPWYRQSWQAWPSPLRAVSFLLLASAFVGICALSWKTPELASVAAIKQRFGDALSFVNVLWDALNVVAGAAGLAFKKLGTGVIVACLAAATLGYFMCIGLSTACMRLALARR